MASYWSVEAPRIPWDRDGSILNTWDATNIIRRQPQSAMSFLNSESGDNTNANFQTQWNTGGAVSTYIAIAILFPFPRDIYAAFSFGSRHPPSNNGLWQFSSDTTNGVDGTWVNISQQKDNTYVKPYYRTRGNMVIPAQSSDTENIRGVRLWYGFSGTTFYGDTSVLRTIHLYGWPSQGATTERLEFWHPTSNAILPANWFDYGDFPRSSSADKAFRIKNLSTTKTATTIVLQPEVLSDTSPSLSGQFVIGDPTNVFLGSQTIGSLAPGAISGKYTLRRTTPADAQLSTWSARLNTTVTSWA